ncbi:MAG TPA: enoyl-CoA hydratase/isomerase family protein [Oligoflexus sp.]|uniref:enoyl-CoA hydratase/isomerase family protein n=1 Tax=Oligoflexus sp. TaxID=1971216 RepID=UPI002D5F7237|nr:enoyl-CoA hydratase/isomerase family protein [Oligoflexus sp.]HYX37637.1 enoyl-CoA hydratase/isomerase family protein [Oligoflexus sp.]
MKESMLAQSWQTVRLHENEHVLTITLHRPQFKNAMNQQMVQELRSIFAQLQDRRDLFAVVLRGQDGHFCAGGDIKDMAPDPARSRDQQISDLIQANRNFGHLLEAVNSCRHPVIGVVEGAVLGGGFGLCCVTDVALAHEQASFGLPETSLGLIPAQIAPFIALRIGLTQARRLALLGMRFKGRDAKELGLVHSTFTDEADLKLQLESVLQQIRKCAPGANAVTKKLLLQLAQPDLSGILDQAAESFAQALLGAEGIAGRQAFLEKKSVDWMKLC